MSFTPAHHGGSGSPLVLLHGFTDTWRTWELVLPTLERHHEVLAPTLAGHAGGPPLVGEVTDALLADGVERAMDAAGLETAHVVGNSLGGYVALQLAERGRARSVQAFAPAGGWALDDPAMGETLDYFVAMQRGVKVLAGQVDSLVASAEGRRNVTRFIVNNYEHIPAELIAHMMLGVARSEVAPLVEYARAAGYGLDPERITCPVRIVWGTGDLLLGWPTAAARYREEWVPGAEWVELDGVGHCPQLDVPLEAAQLILDFSTSP
ncbi:MAG TPA: alpha/beta fold hydrolase [Solirubrobacterales bacterium]|nr:alpha/beta fold hydrolase [Solirubrobacterales bacterium]